MENRFLFTNNAQKQVHGNSSIHTFQLKERSQKLKTDKFPLIFTIYSK